MKLDKIVATRLRQSLDVLNSRGELRKFVSLERTGEGKLFAKHPETRERVRVTAWTSNDYLNLSRHPSVLKGAIDAMHSFGVSSGGTRFLGGTTSLHSRLEERLAQLHQKESAILFTSGYIANQAFLESFLSGIGQGSVVLSDSQNHASIIDGIRRAKARGFVSQLEIFEHNNVTDLQRRLSRNTDIPKLVVTESVFSMTGGHSPLKAMSAVVARENAMLYVDEVHAVGLYGNHGQGLLGQLGVEAKATLIQGTLAKAFGAAGGYVAGPKEAIDYVRANAPPFIFSSSLPPPILGAALAALDVCASPEGKRLRAQQRERTEQLFHCLRNKYDIPAQRASSSAHLITVPLKIGASAARRLSFDLLSEGVYAQAVVYPTVARGEEILRLVATPEHTIEEIEFLCKKLKKLIHQ